jgi:putative ABC transport system permease protein
VSRLPGGLRGLFGRRGLERDLDEEFRAHVAHRADDLIAGGMDPDEARRQARQEFGDQVRLREECAEARRRTARRGAGRMAGLGPGPVGVPDRVRQDLAFALRQSRRAPGFTTVAALTLALGIAATATIVAVVQAVVLAPLPFAEPDHVVYVEELTPAGQTFSVSEPNYVDWRERTSSFSEMGARAMRGATLQQRGDPRSVSVGFASASLLPTLGVEPILGRGFTEHEDRPGTREPLAVLGYALWQDAFGGDADVLGQDVVLDGRAYQVVGVLPPNVPWLDGADLHIPLGANPALDRGEHYLDVWGRLAPGATLASARTEMAALAGELGRVHPVTAGWSVHLQTARDVLVGTDLALAGWVLLGGAALLLLIACVNVSNLLLARASVRRAELAVRAALGAGRRRIAGQLLTESAVLAAAGGGLGLVATLLVLPVVRGMGDGRIPRLDQATVSPTVWLTCLGAVALSTLAFGLAPVLAYRPDRTADTLRGARGLDGPGGRRTRGALVSGQIALSLVLLVSTGLLIRSFTRLAAVDPGFEPTGTLTARLSMPDASVSWEERAELVPRVLAAIEALPGVEHAGATAVDPFSGQNLMNFVAREDRMPSDAREFTPVAWRVVTPGFVEAMGMEMRAGRSFLDSDDGEWAGQAVMIGESLARRLWGDAGGGPVADAARAANAAAHQAVGRTLVWGDPTGTRMTVVGVVEDLNDWRLDEEPFPVVYRAHRQISWSVMTIVVRARGDAGALAGELRTALQQAAPGLAVPEVRSLDWHLRRATAEPRFHALLMGVFAAAGLTLALVGVYGITAFSVSRRLKEIGIRLTLGGDPASIRRMVLLDSTRLALAGAAVGALAAWVVGRALAGLLFRTQPTDPVTWITVLAILVGGAVVAAWLPARRATRVDPREVLGGE